MNSELTAEDLEQYESFEIPIQKQVSGLKHIDSGWWYKFKQFNSTNGLVIDITANVIQTGVNYPIQWVSFDAFPPITSNPIGNTITINATIPIVTVGVGYQIQLDSVFTNDFTGNNGSAISTIIS